MLKRLRPLVPAVMLCAVLAAPWNARAMDLTLQNVPARVIFSPGEKQTEALVKEIDGAAMEVLVQSYSLESPRIVKALQEATMRAVSVEVMLDGGRQYAKTGSLVSLTNAKIPVYLDRAHGIVRSEIIIIDKATVITGYFSLSAGAAERSGENLLILRSKDLASLYLDNWLIHKQHSVVYQYEKKPVGKKKSKSLRGASGR